MIETNNEKEKEIDNKQEPVIQLEEKNIENNNKNDKEDNNLNKEEEKTKEENIFEKYSILNNPGLSDITKAYLSSYTSTARHELSDFGKAYLSTNEAETSNNARPELSNLTMEYLMENTKIFNQEEKEEKK